MKRQQEDQSPLNNAEQEALNEERRKAERRQYESKGYCYIEMVGWMDRRECIRRHENRCRG